MRGECCQVAVSITFLHLKIFLWRSLLLEESTKECSLVEDQSCDQIIPAWYRILGNDTIISCEKQGAGGHLPAPSYLLARPGWWVQRSFCWDAKARSCHSKESWLKHFRLINKFVLFLEIVNWTTTSKTHAWLNYKQCWNSWWWLSLSYFLQRVLAFISYLSYHPSSLPHLPKWLGSVINWSG